MDDNEIKKLLDAYVNAEMSLIDMNDYDVSTYTVSTKYKKKIKKLFSIEKYFGKNLKLGYAVRKAAIIAICILSLLGANEISAHVFGFNPWKYIVSYLSGGNMEQKRYTTPNSSDSDTANIKIAIRDFPEYIPDDLKQNQYDDSIDSVLYIDWFDDDQKRAVQYERIKITENTTIATDSEYTRKEKCEIGGYLAYYYQKDDENWIMWDDKEYNYQISIIGFSEPKAELIKIATSIYQ